MNPKFLTYKDIVLRKSDVQSLKSCNYLNDTVIDFYFAHLSTCYPSDEILLIPTSISFLLANAFDWDIFIATVESLNLHNKKLIFFTINDNSNFESTDGGSHWSLLVYCKKRNLFMHYDSLNSMNYKSAFSIYEPLNAYISHDSAKFMECLAPQQRNGYDCGLYVMEISRTICESYFNVDRFLSKDDDEFCGSFDVVRSVNCNYVEFEMRSELLQFILKLKEEETKSQ